jgi:hypothetical protein
VVTLVVIEFLIPFLQLLQDQILMIMIIILASQLLLVLPLELLLVPPLVLLLVLP